MEGYVTEFVVDTITSYSEAERKFFRGSRGRYLPYLKTWIKMLVCKKRNLANVTVENYAKKVVHVAAELSKKWSKIS